MMCSHHNKFNTSCKYCVIDRRSAYSEQVSNRNRRLYRYGYDMTMRHSYYPLENATEEELWPLLRPRPVRPEHPAQVVNLNVNLDELQDHVIYTKVADLNKSSVIVNNNITVVCTICQIDTNNMIVRKLVHCNHIYHQSCIDTWFETHQTCPNCRNDIRSMT